LRCSKPKMKSDSAAGLYVHVPFCKGKCPYCDFYSITDPGAERRWARALIREGQGYRADFSAFDSLYLGGGTPSVLPDDLLAELLAGLDALRPFASESERTIECNPNDLSPERIECYRSLGFNRISLGIQSLDDTELAFLGRRHRRSDTLRALDWVRERGPNNLGIDLIYGFAGHSIARWRSTLEAVLRYQPQHLSCYQLTLADRTPFGRAAATGQPRLATPEEQADLFLFTAEFLGERGFLHYEVSNFARDSTYRCRHNLKYWSRAPYLGLGPAAHSHRDGVRWWNPASVEAYCRAVEVTGSAAAGREQLSSEQIRLEDLALGFRTREGVALEQLDPGAPRTQAAIAELLEAGLATLAAGRLRPTTRGFLVADGLSLLFVA